MMFTEKKILQTLFYSHLISISMNEKNGDQ